MTSTSANRDLWNRTSAEYQQRHDPQIGAAPRLWGMFSIPDAELGAPLGEVTGQRVLELGCGAGQWSRSLVAEAGRLVGFDLSDAQLAAARQAMITGYPLVQGAAQQLPFAGASFDLVFCDHGALSWAPPAQAVPEAARVLRPGGRLVFSVASPWLEVCADNAADRITASLRQDYFGMYETPAEDGATSYTPTYGAWIRILTGAGLVIDDLIEPRPGATQRSTYLECDPPDWASHWPCELLWVTHKP